MFGLLIPGDIIIYMDLNRQIRQLRYISTPGLVRAIVGQDYCPQHRFEDETGRIMHIPANAWAVAGIIPTIRYRGYHGPV